MRHYVSVKGSDGYRVLVAWGGIDPHFANQSILLATNEDGRPLDLDMEGARLVVPGNLRGGRYVFNVAEVRLAG